MIVTLTFECPDNMPIEGWSGIHNAIEEAEVQFMDTATFFDRGKCRFTIEGLPEGERGLRGNGTKVL